MSFPAFVFKPRPQCPPIWIGGNGPNAIARVSMFVFPRAAASFLDLGRYADSARFTREAEKFMTEVAR